MPFIEWIGQLPILYPIEWFFILVLLVLPAALLTWYLIWYFKIGKKRRTQYNEAQKKYLTFRTLCYMLSFAMMQLLDLLTKGLPKPTRMICIEIPILLYLLVPVAGRLIYGEESRLRPKKDKPIHNS